MNLTKIFRVAAISFTAALGFASPADAAVTNVFFSLGTTCSGAQSTSFVPGGATVSVSLCMSGDSTGSDIKSCGHTILLQSANGAESGAFTVIDYTLGSSFADFNSLTKPVPLSITNPAAVADFGGTILSALPYVPVPLVTGQLLATFTLQPNASATNPSYTIGLSDSSVVAIDKDSACGGGTPLPPPASNIPSEFKMNGVVLLPAFTLTRTNSAPVFASPAAATFTTTATNTFIVSATGNPTPTISLTSGTLPTGVTFVGGVLSGQPTTAAVFNLTFTATSGAGSTPQPFVLTTTSGQGAQTISFAGPSAQIFSSTPIALTATATSGLPVTFTSTTLGICTVSGANVTMVSTGQCTINANQSGNTSYSSAPQVTRSFSINGTVPGAPTIGSAGAGNALATVAFTPPVSTGGSVITGYIATCTSPSAAPASASGTVSPITVTGLVNGTLYNCSVAAINALGTGLPSGTVGVTPSSGVALALIGVQSRKVHAAGAGTFEVPINFLTIPSGAVDTEPRVISTGHTIVFQFNQPIVTAGSVTLADASATLTGGIGTASVPVVSPTVNNEVIVTLTGTLDNRRVTINLSGVNGTGGGSPTVGFLVGDGDNTRAVNVVDVSGVRARTAQPTNAQNFRWDVDLTGGINVVDVSSVRSQTGKALP